MAVVGLLRFESLLKIGSCGLYSEYIAVAGFIASIIDNGKRFDSRSLMMLLVCCFNIQRRCQHVDKFWAAFFFRGIIKCLLI